MVPGTTLQVVPVSPEQLNNQNDVVCIVQDETLLVHDWRASKFHINLPRSTTVHDLYVHTGKEFKYEENSFLLVWKRSATGQSEEEVELKDDLENMTLQDVGLPPEKKKQRFYLRQKEGCNPVSTNLGIQENTPCQNGGDVLEDGSIRNLFDVTTSTASTSSPQYGPYNASSSTSNYGDVIAKSETGFVGLVNQAMTCYLNSLLQTLFMIPEFRNAIYTWKFHGKEEEGVKSISYQLQRLFVCLQFSNKRAVETTDVTRSFGWDSSHAWQQHDVQELCRLMFDELEKDFKDTEQDDLINALYQGKMKDYVKCLECEYESARNDTFLDIPLVVRPFGSDTPHGSVEEALDAFVNPETLEGNNQYKCDKCDKFCDAHKGLKFCSFPHLLTLHLKRFAFDYNLLHRVKLNDRMTFRKQLNLNRYVTSDDEEKDGVPQQSYSPCSIDTDSGVSLAASDNSAEDELQVNDGAMEVTNDKLDQPQPFDDEFEGDGMEELNTPKGPYIYELFSIMIHSGSAMGGHYYAYIRSFTDNQWYSFNDQTVTRITDSDIKRTFGGFDSSSRGYYSSHYSSSANAYMLMYRQVKENEVTFMLENDLPDHVKNLVVKLHEEEKREQELKDWQRSVCKIKLFHFHSIKQILGDAKLEIHKDKTLKEATEMARKKFNLENSVSLENCRIVKYDEYNENIELSFEGKEETDVGTLFGGVKQAYLFDLLLEIKSDEEEFPVYKQGGITVKVHQVNVEEETVSPAFSIRVLWTDSLKTLQDTIRKKLGTSCQKINMVWERYTADFSEIIPSESKTLRDENFFKKNKIYVECTDDEAGMSTTNSTFLQVLENFSNSICLQITLPNDVYTTENNILEMVINRRITLSEFKEKLENRMGCSSEMFKVFRLYSNNQEMEMDRLNDTFSSMSDHSKIVVKYGRALKKDEFRAKVFLLRINNAEHTKLLIETIVSKGMTVLEWKKNLHQEINQTCQKNIPVEKMRLRKKNWKSPGKILRNDQKYDDIVCTGTTEVFLEELEAPELFESDTRLAIYIRRWRPSSYTFEDMQELVVDEAATVPDLKGKLSEISKIAVSDIEIAKGRGSFPFEVSVLETNNDLEWNPSETSRLRDYPIMVHDDGVLFYYRDKTEPLAELSVEKRNEIKKNENHGSASSSIRSTYKPKEKALKIYTDR